MGQTHKFLKKIFQKNLKIPYSTCVSSCTAALYLSYLAIGVKQGDEIVVPKPNSCLN